MDHEPPAPDSSYLDRYVWIERLHPLSGYVERTPGNPPSYDAKDHQAALYAHRHAITRLRAGWGDVCTGCTREGVQQVVDFHPETGQPRGLLCRECRHLVRWQVWQDGALYAWLNALVAAEMQCRVACTCRLLHAHDSDEAVAACEELRTRWGRLANYLADTEPPPVADDTDEPYVVMTREKRRTGDEAPVPLFLAPGSGG